MSAALGGLALLHIDTERGWRGGERQVLWLAETLERSGHRNIIAARPAEPLARRAAERGLAVVACAPRSEFAFLEALKLRRLIRRERIDIVHAHTGHAVALAALATRGTAAAMVLTRRVIVPLRRNPLTRWKFARARAIIAVSRAAAETLTASGLDSTDVAIIPSGIDPDRHVARADSEELAALGVRAGPLVVMVAALTAEKDPVTFVRALDRARRELPGVQGLMVGDGPMRTAVEAEIARLGLGHALLLAGNRGDAESLMAAADVVVLTSRREGLGTVLLDAASLGRPVVATSVGGIPEVVQHEESGLLVPPGDADAISTAIVRILTDDFLRDRLSRGALQRAGEFTVVQMAERTAAVYRRVLDRAGGQ